MTSVLFGVLVNFGLLVSRQSLMELRLALDSIGINVNFQFKILLSLPVSHWDYRIMAPCLDSWQWNTNPKEWHPS